MVQPYFLESLTLGLNLFRAGTSWSLIVSFYCKGHVWFQKCYAKSAFSPYLVIRVRIASLGISSVLNFLHLCLYILYNLLLVLSSPVLFFGRVLLFP